jgi:hypothetical protein
MNERQYRQTVKELRALVGTGSRNQWQMGDLILALTPYVGKGHKRPAESPRQVVERISDDLGGELRPQTLLNLRATSLSWPPRERKKASWSAHFHLRSNPEMLTDGMTTPEAHLKVARKPRNRFNYACRLLRSSITFMQSAERYMPEFAPDDEHMSVIGPLIADAEEALQSLLEAAGMEEVAA